MPLMLPSKKERPVVEPKIRALRNDYAEVKTREKELISRFEALSEDCEHKIGEGPGAGCVHRGRLGWVCQMQHCPFIGGK